MEGSSVTNQSLSQRMKFSGCEVSAAQFHSFRREYPCIPPWICVEGYDSSLPRTKIEELLRNHLGSCGHISQIVFYSDTNRYAYLLIYGKDAESNAIKLSGSMIEGHKIVAQARISPLYNVKVTDMHMLGSADTLPVLTRGDFG